MESIFSRFQRTSNEDVKREHHKITAGILKANPLTITETMRQATRKAKKLQSWVQEHCIKRTPGKFKSAEIRADCKCRLVKITPLDQQHKEGRVLAASRQINELDKDETGRQCSRQNHLVWKWAEVVALP